MEESVLKKEFDKKDVQRLRNLIKKDFNASTSTQSGYKKVSEDHVEGDIWEENKKTWTIKNGIKQSTTKLDMFKKLSNTPFICPKCSKPMNHYLDDKMYKVHKSCMDCVIKFETQLKIIGKYVEYEKAIINGNIEFFLKDYENFIGEMVNEEDKSTFITEAGDIEKWEGGKIDKSKLKQEAMEFIETARKSLG